ncbi:zinc ribbon domain-containing protein [Haloarcula sp. S1CR25-12]|uniref:Zinc ribbon domain-containing protein n=1 Tax=Haloarcula saliterrae TaxID=2950534 RepID=A0ABU2FED5_9EURY|nr:zinc ribbon domain-containing protein [Haloarcula sp. S1CR25-12]MDS0260614.1 zinc ribbon domain-containing protein [Haloarcula sp. S1CR25-12]
MSKITFRADDDLIDRLEEFEASKSEVMREALRAYLDGEGDQTSTPSDGTRSATDTESIDALIADRVDAIIADRLETVTPTRQPQDVNVNISLDGGSGSVTDDEADSRPASDTAATAESTGVSHGHEERKTGGEERETDASHAQSSCAQCGENLSSSHVYCPNCGEKASRRVFCDCGDELRSDWGFCPGCGRRTPAADVLEQPRSGANRE